MVKFLLANGKEKDLGFLSLGRIVTYWDFIKIEANILKQICFSDIIATFFPQKERRHFRTMLT